MKDEKVNRMMVVLTRATRVKVERLVRTVVGVVKPLQYLVVVERVDVGEGEVEVLLGLERTGDFLKLAYPKGRWEVWEDVARFLTWVPWAKEWSMGKGKMRKVAWFKMEIDRDLDSALDEFMETTTLNDRKKGIQRRLGLEADGIFGPLTVTALEKALPVPVEPVKEWPSPFARAMRQIALREVGVREIPTNSNQGPRVEEYQAATWLEGTGWPWCAAFVCWVVARARMSEAPVDKFDLPQTASAWGLLDWGRQQGLDVWEKKSPETILPGDIVVYKFSHVGIAAEVDQVAQRLQVVEGNTDERGSREGGGVYLKERRHDQVKGWIRIS